MALDLPARLPKLRANDDVLLAPERAPYKAKAARRRNDTPPSRNPNLRTILLVGLLTASDKPASQSPASGARKCASLTMHITVPVRVAHPAAPSIRCVGSVTLVSEAGSSPGGEDVSPTHGNVLYAVRAALQTPPPYDI
ncbi:hypothetical protein CSUB01_08339 [Colletotrichum sublineola]|uniref:Uncharacterized protein n=1 Tax=Colletotrichum sublineola TaxID=1173701 RepID=A0A066XMI2_COLSU|nr:hypothetical protein CSUB01_08339 [Colletotrichum sublineola]